MPKISEERARSQRLRLVEAAIDAFAGRGYDATTVDDVCRTCGLSKGSVYTYFATKEELFLAASEHVFEQRYATVEGTWHRGRSEAGLDAVLTAFATSLAGTSGSFLRLWVEGFLVAARIPELARMKASYHQRFGDLLIEVLTTAMSDGRLTAPVDPRAAATVLMALADGLMLHQLVPSLDQDRDDEAVQKLVATLAPLVTPRP